MISVHKDFINNTDFDLLEEIWDLFETGNQPEMAIPGLNDICSLKILENI